MTAKQTQLQLIRKTKEIAKRLGNMRDASTLSSLLRQRDRKKLTSRQESFLNSLIERNSEAAVQAKADAKAVWVAEWANLPSDYHEKVRVVAEYYRMTGYFQRAALGVLNWFACEAGKQGAAVSELAVVHELPSQKSIDKMINNKYAQKVWESHTTPPLWAVGDMCTLRANPKMSYPWHYQRVSLTSLMIIEVDTKPIDKALTYSKSSGGTRYYKVLPVGMAQPIDVLECDLKKLLKKQTQ